MSYILKKPYTIEERANFVIKYNAEMALRIEETDKAIYALEPNEIMVDGKPEINPDYEKIKIEQIKGQKILQNDKARDEKLFGGVEYKGIKFDSDTDQKINLLAIVSSMSDKDAVTWFGMNNEPLECTKEDLVNIGSLITELHSFCWNKNAQIKLLIAEAETLEELEKIDISYEIF